MTEAQDQVPVVSFEDLSEEDQIEAMMQITGLDEFRVRWILAIERGEIEGDHVRVDE